MELTFRKSIVAAIVSADMCSLPLTELELWARLPQWYEEARSFGELCVTVANLEHDGILARTDGFLHLPGRGGIVRLRQERAQTSERKFARALSFAKTFARFPFVRAIAVTNTLASGSASEYSDVDFFVVARHGFMWTVRLLIVGCAAVFRVRPGEYRAGHDPICISYLVSDADLSLQRTALPAIDGVPDVHLAAWVSEWCVLYDDGGYLERFRKENAWVNTVYPNACVGYWSPRRAVALPRILAALKRVCEYALFLGGGRVERWARALQMRLMPERVRERANRDTHVILNDSMIKIHLNDRRAQRREEFRARMNEMMRAQAGRV